MSEAAVLELAKPATETVPPDATEAPPIARGADVPAVAQTGDTPATEASATTPPPAASATETPPATDPVAAALAAGDRKDEEARIEAEVRRRVSESTGEARKQSIKTKHQQALAHAQALVEEYGLAAGDAQPLFDAANAAHMEADEQHRLAYEQAFRELVPEAGREAFDQATEGKSLTPAEYLTAVMETRSLQSKAVNQASLADLLEHSSKARADFRKLRPDNPEEDERYLAGFQAGLKSPAGDLSTGGGVHGATYSTVAELSRAFNADRVDRKTYASEYQRLTGRAP